MQQHPITFTVLLLMYQLALFCCSCCSQQYPIDNKVLLAIEVVVMAILEAKRYEGYKKTGEVRRGGVCYHKSMFLEQQQQQSQRSKKE
jgi:hypothetical protein